MELIILDKNLIRLGSVDYKSLIWIDRYNRVGSSEIYAPGTSAMLALLKKGNLVKRTDRTSVFIIKYVHVETAGEEGDVITAFAYDAKGLLDQRVNTDVRLFQSYDAGNDLELLLQQKVLSTSAPAPFLKADGSALFAIRPPASVAGVCNQAIQYLPWGQVARQICGYLGYGYSVNLVDLGNPSGRQLRVQVYAGQDRSRSVRFARTFENVGAESYETDDRNKGNVILVKSRAQSTIAVYGSAESTDRAEVWLETQVDPEWSYSDIRELLEGTFSLQQNGSSVILRATQLYIPILSDWQLTRLRTAYPRGSTTQRDGYYYLAASVAVATAARTTVAAVTDSTSFLLEQSIFDYLLLTEAVAVAEEHKVIDDITTEITNNRFVYGVDYNLGDLVLVQSKYGPSSVARVVEVLECWDENGYRLEPRTSYSEV